jgi:hypothetical protein
MIGDKACVDILLRSERVARAARRGLWEDPNFAPLRPEHLNRIAGTQGQFALVEGKSSIVGARKRRHNIFELRAAFDARFYGNDS